MTFNIQTMKTALLSAAAAAILLGCSPNHHADDTAHTTLYTNANIITQNPDMPRANYMAVSNGKIIAIGRGEFELNFGKSASMKDMKGAVITPGFIDSHVHVRELGLDAVKADLVGVKNIDDIVARLKSYAPNPVPGEWIIGQGWDEGYFGSVGYPDRAKLDAAFPNNPVGLESLHGFAGFYPPMSRPLWHWPNAANCLSAFMVCWTGIMSR